MKLFDLPTASNSTPTFRLQEIIGSPDNPPDSISVSALLDLLVEGVQSAQLARFNIPNGGLSLSSAKKCLLEEQRTFKILRAVFQRINELKTRKQDHYEVVDAGCGPLPIWGIVAALNLPNSRVTCLEVNPASALMAASVIKRFGLEKKIKVIRTDAKNYASDKPIDLAISETLYTGLMEEPFAAIAEQLKTFMKPDGFIIPQSVDVLAAVRPETDATRMELTQELPVNMRGHLVDIKNLQSIQHWIAGRALTEISAEVPVPNDASGTQCCLILAANVNLTDDWTISGVDSLISAPTVVGHNLYPRTTVNVCFTPGVPRNEVKVISDVS